MFPEGLKVPGWLSPPSPSQAVALSACSACPPPQGGATLKVWHMELDVLELVHTDVRCCEHQLWNLDCLGVGLKSAYGSECKGVCVRAYVHTHAGGRDLSVCMYLCVCVCLNVFWEGLVHPHIYAAPFMYQALLQVLDT